MKVDPRTVNVITRWVILAPVIAWGVWELSLFAFRVSNPGVRTISQEARSIAARGMPSLAFFWGGMTCHWFVTWRRLPWTGTAAGIATLVWWLGLAAYALSDLFVPEARTWLRWPPVAALLGAVSAFLLFGQTSVWTPGSAP